MPKRSHTPTGCSPIFASAKAASIPLTLDDSSNPGGVKPSTELRNYLDKKPGYFILIGPNDQVLYNSVLIRMLAPTDGDSLLQYAKRLRPSDLALVPITADTTNFHKLAIRARAAGSVLEPNINRIVVGLPDTDVDLSGQLLTGTMIVMLPFVLLVCSGAAYFMAGQVFKPMHDLTNQLEAITDGRSLHRRLPPDVENDELGRMVTTLNAMLSRLEVSFAALAPVHRRRQPRAQDAARRVAGRRRAGDAPAHRARRPARRARGVAPGSHPDVGPRRQPAHARPGRRRTV